MPTCIPLVVSKALIAAAVLYWSSVSTQANAIAPLARSIDPAQGNTPTHIRLFAPIRYCLPLVSV